MARGAVPGTIVGGRYRLLGQLGGTGPGRVWQARDEPAGTEVDAREIWLPPAASEREAADWLAMAQHRARLLAGLPDHPHIVKVLDALTDGGALWIITRQAPGRPLAQCFTAERPLTVEEATRVAGAVLDALDTVHRAGILHRAITPASVIMADHGAVLLTDFDVAPDRADAAATQGGTLLGSIEYLAPECAHGRPAEAASDLYGLGVTLYHAVEGHSPFRRDGLAATLNAVLYEEAPPPGRAGHLAPLITALMAKDPSYRPGVAQARGSLTVWPTLVAPAPVEPPAPGSRTAVYPATMFGAVPPPAGAAPPLPGFPPPPGGPGPAAAGFPAGGQPPLDAGMVPQPPRGAATAARTLAVLLAVAAVVAAVVIVVLHTGGNSDHTAAGTTPSASPDTTTPYTAPSWTPSPYTPEPDPTYSYPSYAPPSTDAPPPPDFDEAAGDTTPISPSALMPDSFTDSNGVFFQRVGGGVTSCLNAYEGTTVHSAFAASGCTQLVEGSYVDTSDQILVSVWVIPMLDSTTATTAYAAVRGADTTQWGLSCPSAGPGSAVCTAPQSELDAARVDGWTGVDHRYLIHASALYIDLGTGTSLDASLSPASEEAELRAGPDNYYNSNSS